MPSNPWPLMFALGIAALMLGAVIAVLVLNLRTALAARLDAIEKSQQRGESALREELRGLTESIQTRLHEIRQSMDEKLRLIQDDNAKRLEQMRLTVDEKLQGTLEKRLGESFKLVSDRLEQVHKGLGEMQKLASGVDKLQNLMTGVKTRGIWGEVQLAALLEQILTPQQYEANVATRPRSSERVEFAIKLPGRDGTEGQVWLPVDAKFPQEDYQRLLDAQNRADPEAAEAAGRALETRVKQFARDIRDKYLSPPATTDFGIMFIPAEGLYAELLRRPGVVEQLQREYRVVVAGPTTLAALLNSLQMGFRTLAIEKRSAEVWNLLGAVRTQFDKFGEVLEGVKKKLDEASNKIEDAQTRSRVITTKLRKVAELPADQAQALLGDTEAGEESGD